MFIELIDSLRCPRPHEDTWLVGAFDRLVDRDVRAGTLGCPICRAEYPIREGVVIFADSSPSPREEAAVGDAAAEAMRLGALLNLVGDGGIVVLGGGSGMVAAALRELVSVELLLLDPPSGVAERERLSAMRTAGSVPLAPGSCRGIVLDVATSSLGQLEGAARALRPRGRLVAPAGVAVPEGIRELARDPAVWVGEREDAAPIVSLGRR